MYVAYREKSESIVSRVLCVQVRAEKACSLCFFRMRLEEKYATYAFFLRSVLLQKNKLYATYSQKKEVRKLRCFGMHVNINKKKDYIRLD